MAGDLGKFGMGMVTASIGLSKRLEIVTRVDGNGYLFGGFDLDEIYEQNKFVKWIETADGEQASHIEGEHGTFLQLSKTDRISNRHPTTFANTLKLSIPCHW